MSVSPSKCNNTKAAGNFCIRKIFFRSGCTPPGQGQQFQGQNGPGGRAGPPPAGDSNSADAQCFGTVNQKKQEQFNTCMKQKDPDFGKFGPPTGGGGPPPGGPVGSGPPPGGPGGFGPQPGGANGPQLENLAQFCNNDQDKANKLQQCLKEVHENHKPEKAEVKAHYDAICMAEEKCKPK